MNTKIIRNFLIFLLFFLGIGAFYGGGAFILDPSGNLLQMPLEALESSPFNNFLIPGIVLFLVLGVFPMFLIYALLKKPENHLAEMLNFFHDMHWAWSFTIYQGFALVIWITLQVLFINAVHWIHTVYVFKGLIIIFLALLPGFRKNYRN